MTSKNTHPFYIYIRAIWVWKMCQNSSGNMSDAETLINRTGDPAWLHAQLAGRWRQNEVKLCTVREKYFVLSRLEPPRQDKNILYKSNEPTKEGPLSYVCTPWIRTSVSFMQVSTNEAECWSAGPTGGEWPGRYDFVSDRRGRTACLFPTVPAALTGAAQLRDDGTSSCCYIINVYNHPSWATSRKEGMAWYSSSVPRRLYFPALQ